MARRVLRERTGVSVLRGGAALQLSVDTVAVSNAEGYTLTSTKKAFASSVVRPPVSIMRS